MTNETYEMIADTYRSLKDDIEKLDESNPHYQICREQLDQLDLHLADYQKSLAMTERHEMLLTAQLDELNVQVDEAENYLLPSQ